MVIDYILITSFNINIIYMCMYVNDEPTNDSVYVSQTKNDSDIFISLVNVDKFT